MWRRNVLGWTETTLLKVKLIVYPNDYSITLRVLREYQVLTRKHLQIQSQQQEHKKGVIYVQS